MKGKTNMSEWRGYAGFDALVIKEQVALIFERLVYSIFYGISKAQLWRGLS